MGFFRRRAGIMALLLCLGLLAAAVWYCMYSSGFHKTPQGTLVYQGCPLCTEVSV